MSDFDGKVAIVTGSASGIGEATAKLLAARGAAVVVADINASGAKEVADQIRSTGGRAIHIAVDVGDEDQVARMVEAATAEFGGLDVLHNNAAMVSPDVMALDGQVTEADLELWNRVFRVNLFGCMLGAKHAIPAMLQRGGGVIVNTASGTGLQAELSRTAYATSKAAIVGFTRNVATQYGKQGIRCVALALGLVATPALKANMPPPVQELFLAHHLTNRLAEPEDIAEVVAFVASDKAAFITGSTIPVDGGFSVHTPSWADEVRLMAGAPSPS